MKHQFMIIAILLSSLSGCSSSPLRYNSDDEKNVTINLNIDIKSGLFSTVEVVAGINDFNKLCQSHYRGHVALKPGANKIALAPDQLTYLLIDVVQNSPTKNTRFGRGTLIKPVKGRQYEIDVSYIKNMYDLKLFESGNTKKLLTLSPASACKQE